MKRLRLTIASLLLTLTVSPLFAIDLGGGYTKTEDLKRDAHNAVLALLGYKLENYKDAQEQTYFSTRIVHAKKAVNTFVYNRQLELKSESTPEDRTLGDAVAAYKRGNIGVLFTWINANQVRHPADVIKTPPAVMPTVPPAVMPTVPPAVTPTAPPAVAPTVPPKLPPVSDDDDDNSDDVDFDEDDDEEDDDSDADVDDQKLSELYEDQKELEADLAAIILKVKKAEKELSEAKAKLNKKNNKENKRKVQKSKEKLESLQKARAKYDAKLKTLEAQIVELLQK